jgi:hypothetical protein
MDLFNKCTQYTAADEAKQQGIYPYFHALESKQDIEVVMEGERRIMLGSNNYLGLTVSPDVIEAGVETMRAYGTGCSGSRFLNGTLKLHLELEKELAQFLHKEAVMTFSTASRRIWASSARSSAKTTTWSATATTTPASTTDAGSATAKWNATSTTTWRLWRKRSRTYPKTPGF